MLGVCVGVWVWVCAWACYRTCECTSAGLRMCACEAFTGFFEKNPPIETSDDRQSSPVLSFSTLAGRTKSSAEKKNIDWKIKGKMWAGLTHTRRGALRHGRRTEGDGGLTPTASSVSRTTKKNTNSCCSVTSKDFFIDRVGPGRV